MTMRLFPLWLQWIKLWNRSGMSGMLFGSILIGILGGLGSAAFRQTEFEIRWLYSGTHDDIVTIAEHLSPWFRIGIPTLGGLVAGLFLWLSHQGGRAQDYLEVIRLGDGTLPVKSNLARLFSSITSIASGASIGREGGMVQLSALLASTFARWIKPSITQRRLMIACGAAAGLSAAYNTPISGALFIAEIVVGTLAIEVLGPLFIASLSATVVMHHWIGLRPIFDLPDAAKDIDMELDHVALLGFVAGILAPALLVFLGASRKLFFKLHLPIPFRIALGGLIVGVISVKVPEVWGNGHHVVEHILTESPAIDFVLIILAMKLLATGAAFGSGTVGGIFTPTLMFGACLGWLFGHLFNAPLTADVAYATIGMGALLSGTTLAPLMAVLMVFEMTLDAKLIFPIAVACLIARYVASAIRPVSVYHTAIPAGQRKLPFHTQVEEIQKLNPKSYPLSGSLESTLGSGMRSSSLLLWITGSKGRFHGAVRLEHLNRHALVGFEKKSIADFIEKDFPTLMESAPLTEALTLMTKNRVDRLPVLNQDGMLVGEVLRRDLFLSLSFLHGPPWDY